MFEKVYIRRFETVAGTLSLGTVADLTLFYGEVVVEINIGWVIKALELTSPDTLIRLNKEFGVRFVYTVDSIGALTETPQGSFIQRYIIGLYEISMTTEKKDGKQEIADRILLNRPRYNWNKNDIIRFLDVCEFKCHNDMIQRGQNFVSIAGSEILDKLLSAADISEIVRSIAPGYQLPDDVRFHGIKSNPRDEKFMLVSNINLDDLNMHLTYQTGERMTYLHLLSMYGNARFELSACASQGCDFVSDDASGAIIRRRVNDLVHATDSRLSEINLFQERTLGQSKAVAQAIDAGEKSLDDFLLVLEQAIKFKAFISNADNEAGLIDHYIREVSARSWIDRLPSKFVRLAIFQVAAISAGVTLSPVAGAAIGVGLGALDSFVIDKIAHRWRPNQFVDDVLKPFASGRKLGA